MRVSATASLVSLLALAACGSDRSAARHEEVRAVVESYVRGLIDGDPAVCQLVTDKARGQLVDSAGLDDVDCPRAIAVISRIAAQQGDLAEARTALSFALPTVRITISGDRAEAAGGRLHGSSAAYLPAQGLRLIQVDGQWRVDSGTLRG